MNFKKEAQQHQLHFFSKEENQSSYTNRQGRAQPHWLNEHAAAQGKIFYSDYGIFSEAKSKRGNKNTVPEWFFDTLRSQHIPYNFFIPFKTEKELAVKVLNKLLLLEIDTVDTIEIEFPPKSINPLGDNTSFDAFIEYSAKGEKGFLGIEVKYTEGGYSPTDKEKGRIKDEDSVYYKETSAELYKNTKEPKLTTNTYRQIWRNHILASAYSTDKYKQFISVTLYPHDNMHFESAIYDYKAFLTEAGKKTLIGITYEEFMQTFIDSHNTEKQKLWIKYLIERYIIGSKDQLLNQKEEGQG